MADDERPEDGEGGAVSVWNLALEPMPGKRYRVRPELVPDLMCWLGALKVRYEREKNRTLRGLKGGDRARARGQRQAAALRCAILDWVMSQLHDTVDAELIRAARREWDAIIAALPSAGG